MKVLFARIGWMKFYQGPQKGDEKPIGGGSYNKDEIGHEIYNFKNIGNYVYGYFQPNIKGVGEIRLERIDPEANGKDTIDNVLVIWFARSPDNTGQNIIGWYKNSIVYRKLHSANNLPERDNFSYIVKCEEKNAVLLPISKRKYTLGHNLDIRKGNPGQSNVFYIYGEDRKLKDPANLQNKWVYDAIKYVNNYNGLTISSFEDVITEEIKTESNVDGGQGFQTDTETRLAIEKHAMNICKDYYKNQGYHFDDVSKTKPYDLEISKGGSEKILIEVKGTQSDGKNIILTKNEVEMADKYADKMVLFLVHSIVLKKKKIIGHSIKIIMPWSLNKLFLTPISYTYDLSMHEKNSVS